MKPQQKPFPAELTHPGNPVLQEVLSHISPQYRSEVAALIDDLGLEVVGRTRMAHANDTLPQANAK